MKHVGPLVAMALMAVVGAIMGAGVVIGLSGPTPAAGTEVLAAVIGAAVCVGVCHRIMGTGQRL